jgi:hypothetical protein
VTSSARTPSPASGSNADRLDPEALGYMADVLARIGRRDDSIRTLSGAVDLQPDDRALHERLAAAFERVGAAERACAHRIALAAISPPTPPSPVARSAASAPSAARPPPTASSPPPTHSPGRRSSSPPPSLPAGERATGDLVLRATWSGGPTSTSA